MFDLVAAKLLRSLVRDDTIRRSLLIERLACNDACPIVSVVAPAGYISAVAHALPVRDDPGNFTTAVDLIIEAIRARAATPRDPGTPSGSRRSDA